MADASTSEPRMQPGARLALMLLLAINLFNYIDRQVLAAVSPTIKRTFLQNDEFARTKLGTLNTVFLLSYMVIAPLFGWLGDRMSRWILVAIGVILWSIASGASGLASCFAMLLITRCFVGIGEGAYGPVAPTLLSDLFAIRIRGRVMAIFYAAIPVGGALGYVLGGAVEDALGWRWAFYLVLPPGILLGVLCLFMREPARGEADSRNQPKRSFHWRDYLVLAKTPSYVLNTLGMTAMSFAIGGLAYWMPDYILNRQSICTITEEALVNLDKVGMPSEVIVQLRSMPDRNPDRKPNYAGFVKQLEETLTREDRFKYSDQILSECCTPSLGRINMIFGVIVVVSGLAATLLGGWAGDFLRQRFPGSYFLVSGLSMMFAFPMILLILFTDFPLAWVFLFLAVFFLFFNTGPTNTILANVTHPSIRSSAYALNILIIHSLGDAISPPVMGFIADRRGMDSSLACVSVVVILGGFLWLLGVKHLQRDTALAPTKS